MSPNKMGAIIDCPKCKKMVDTAQCRREIKEPPKQQEPNKVDMKEVSKEAGKVAGKAAIKSTGFLLKTTMKLFPALWRFLRKREEKSDHKSFQASKKKSGCSGCLMVFLALFLVNICTNVSDGPRKTRNYADYSDYQEYNKPEQTQSKSPKKTGQFVTQSQFGNEWPFTVKSGFLECKGGNRIVFTAGGITYGLNGAAQGAGYPEPNDIWKDDPRYDTQDLGYTLKVSISTMISKGLELCE